ncbi:MAG: MarR family winged helix-turn-helix transcriptional regulator [Geodermatophilaceae bacterium]
MIGSDAAPADDPDSTPHQSLERELTILYRRWRGTANRLSHAVHPDLDAAGYGVLVLLDDTGPLHASELTVALGLDKSTVSRHIGRLVELGLVERVADDADRRAQTLTVSAHGKARLLQIRAQRRVRWESDLSRWPRKDVEILAALLARLNEVAERAVAEEHSPG